MSILCKRIYDTKEQTEIVRKLFKRYKRYEGVSLICPTRPSREVMEPAVEIAYANAKFMKGTLTELYLNAHYFFDMESVAGQLDFEFEVKRTIESALMYCNTPIEVWADCVEATKALAKKTVAQVHDNIPINKYSLTLAFLEALTGDTWQMVPLTPELNKNGMVDEPSAIFINPEAGHEAQKLAESSTSLARFKQIMFGRNNTFWTVPIKHPKNGARRIASIVAPGIDEAMRLDDLLAKQERVVKDAIKHYYNSASTDSITELDIDLIERS